MYGAVDGVTINRAGPVAGLTLLIGDSGTGAVTLSVEPSDAADEPPPPLGASGVSGVLELVHARVKPRSAAAPVTASTFRDINRSRNEGTGTGWVGGRYFSGIISCFEDKFSRNQAQPQIKDQVRRVTILALDAINSTRGDR